MAASATIGGFSPTTAATEGFRLIRDHPMAVGLWFLVMAVTSAISLALMGVLVGFSALDAVPKVIESVVDGGPPDIALLEGLMASALSFMLIAIPLALVSRAVLVAAVKRAVLTPEDRTPGYMRLGMDEVRTFLVRLARALIFLGLYIAIAGVGAVLWFVHPILTFFWGLAGITAVIFLSVRLSLAVSQTFVTKRFTLFGSWALTKGRFWPLFLAYLLAGVFLVIVYLVFFAVGGVLGGNSMGDMLKSADEASVAGLGFAMLVNTVISLIQETLGLPITGAATASAYRDIETPETFF